MRTIWAHLVLKHKGNKSRANAELALYRDGDRDSEMNYLIWRDIYLALEARMEMISVDANKAAKDQDVKPGKLRFMWPDAVASYLFETHAARK